MVKIGKLMGLERPSTDSPSHDLSDTPPSSRHTFCSLRSLSVCRTPSVSCIASYASLYSTTLFHTDVIVCSRPCLYLAINHFHACITGPWCMPRICLSYRILLMAKSTERRAFILGSPSFAISQKPRTARRSFLNPRNCDGMPNQLAYGLKETEKGAGNASET
jgi:hypothetical protein